MDICTGGGGGGENYEKTPAHEKYFMKFNQRLRRCPNQIMRYAYSGTPLWPYPQPKSLTIPPCSCGKSRVFELQLLPTLLAYTNIMEDAFAMIDKRSNTIQTKVVESVDWATVAIYVCPDSCKHSDEEVVVIQMPHANTVKRSAGGYRKI